MSNGPPASSRRADLLLAVMATCTFLAVGELSVRMAGMPRGRLHVVEKLGGQLGDWQRTDPELLWAFRPNQDVWEQNGPHGRWGSYHVTTNAKGFRGHQLPDPPGRPLVLCLGDSVTAGFGVDDEDTYPALLEERLRLWPGLGNATVVNAGVHGYSSEQGRILMARLARELEPDLVIIDFGINDDWPTVYPDSLLLEGHGWLRRVQHLLGGSHLYGTLKEIIVRRKLQRAASVGTLGPRVPPAEYRRNLVEMVATARRAEAACILVAPTSKIEHHQVSRSVALHAPLSLYRLVMAQVAEQEGVVMLDHPLLSGRLPESHGYFLDWCHPDASGLCVLASELQPLVRAALAARAVRY